MKHHVIIAAACILFTAAIPVAAAPLALTLLDHPDVTSGFISVSYDAGDEAFHATGFSLSLDDDGVGSALNIDNGTFDITAEIDGTGTAAGGTLIITGDVLGFGPTLLTGDLSAFGFLDSGGDIFEFLFTVTGGDLAIPEFYGTPGPGSTAGIILDAVGSGFGGTFDNDFDNGFGLGESDTAPIPEPGTLFLVLMAGALVRRKK